MQVTLNPNVASHKTINKNYQATSMAQPLDVKPNYKSIFDTNINALSFGHKVELAQSAHDAQDDLNALLNGKKMIAISNRGPNYNPKTGSLTLSAGGLATALSSTLNACEDSTWVCWAGDNSIKENVSHKPEGKRAFGVEHIAIDPEVQENFYSHTANGLLWPVFHFINDEAEHYLSTAKIPVSDEQWGDYKKANEIFAKNALNQASPDKENILWVQDYQLLFTPEYLRKELDENKDVKAKIGYFHHIPFPEASFFIDHIGKDKATEVVHSLLKSDLIAFHVPSYSQNFLYTVEKLQGNLKEQFGLDINKVNYKSGEINYNENGKAFTSKVQSLPINISYKDIHNEADDVTKSIDEQIQYEILNKNPNFKRMVLNIERCDYTKNLDGRLDAIEEYLETTPLDERKDVSFVVAFPKGRMQVPAYRDYYYKSLNKITDINSKYKAQDNYEPIIYKEGIFGTEKFAYMRMSDVLICNPIADGMNLIINEVISSKDFDEGDKPTKVIMSNTPGIAQNTIVANNAINISPSNKPIVSKMIQKALKEIKESPEEALEENLAIKNNLQDNEVVLWARDNIKGILDNQPKLNTTLANKVEDFIDNKDKKEGIANIVDDIHSKAIKNEEN